MVNLGYGSGLSIIYYLQPSIIHQTSPSMSFFGIQIENTSEDDIALKIYWGLLQQLLSPPRLSTKLMRWTQPFLGNL
jgi:hypothetical protein